MSFPIPCNGVSLASPLAVMVVGKKTVVPFGFLLGDKPGDIINGEMLPILFMSSRKEEALVKGEFTNAALVGKLCGATAAKGKVLPMRA